ncbi:unnamed protein product [Rodentolepis nana]|uniref:Peptidase M16 middle/third domain-containing protein n=1 Tax=Rodentolepis nana TaxID=102285 RepID=A0A3P7VFE2_RODNA|nr:unnamed protein product [Rodentolepis nana]
MTFRFKGKEDPFEYVHKLSIRMFKYPPADILTAGYLISEFRPDLIEEIMNCITPENFRYFIVSKKVADSCDSIEQYYKTPYGCEPIPQEKIEAWKNCGLNGALHLPPKNLYIPTDFSLKCELNPDHEDCTLGPRVIEEAPGSLLWFKQDSNFKLPKSFICFNLISPILSQDPIRDLMLELFGGLFFDFVNENTYQYSLAGLDFEVPTIPPTLRLMFAGYSHKMPLLVENTVNALMQFTNPDKERFDVLLRKLELKVKNFTSYSALEQADRHMVTALYDRSYQHEDRVAAVELSAPDNYSVNNSRCNLSSPPCVVGSKAGVYFIVDQEDLLIILKVPSILQLRLPDNSSNLCYVNFTNPPHFQANNYHSSPDRIHSWSLMAITIFYRCRWCNATAIDFFLLLLEITYEDLLQFISTVFNSVYVETLVYGNEDTESALKYKQIIIDALKKYTRWRPPVSSPTPFMREVEVPTGHRDGLNPVPVHDDLNTYANGLVIC